MNPAQHLLTALLKLYQLAVSPVLTALLSPAGACRFTPSCSAYALAAVQSHGALAGVWLTARRLARCHPWGGCGHDPVPPRTERGCARSVSRSAFANGGSSASANGSDLLRPLRLVCDTAALRGRGAEAPTAHSCCAAHSAAATSSSAKGLL